MTPKLENTLIEDFLPALIDELSRISEYLELIVIALETKGKDNKE